MPWGGQSGGAVAGGPMASIFSLFQRGDDPSPYDLGELSRAVGGYEFWRVSDAELVMAPGQLAANASSPPQRSRYDGSLTASASY